MGMAASQARFLGLTARKTNTEYEGQQINQQRTTLGNQSANYYNQLLGMTVPVPPSVQDYTKTVYSFTDGALKNTLTSMIAQQDGTYMVSYNSVWTNDFAVVSAAPVIYTKSAPDANTKAENIVQWTDEGNGLITQRHLGVFRVGSTELRKMGADLSQYKDGDSFKYTGNDPYLQTLTSWKQVENLQKEEGKYLDQLEDKYGTRDWMVRYVYNSTDKSWKPMFTRVSDLTSPNTTYDDNTGTSLSTIKTYSVGSAQETREIKGVTARMEQDSTGRIISVTLNADEPDQAVTYAVTTETVTDQAKYNDAMNQYEYDKYQYDQTIQEVNAKIEIVQAEDRNLELRLKQLDTEQDAIQTEMDAVQKVIEKNTESTFKTFG